MDKIVHEFVTLHCDAHRAFEMFTDNQLLEAWLCVVAEVEPSVGGKYELFWDADDRENDSTIGCKVTAVVPDQLIAFEWRSPRQYKHFANNADPLTHVVVSIIPNDKETVVHMVHSGWRGTPEWEEARVWQARAWQLSFERLEKLVNGD